MVPFAVSVAEVSGRRQFPPFALTAAPATRACTYGVKAPVGPLFSEYSNLASPIGVITRNGPSPLLRCQ